MNEEPTHYRLKYAIAASTTCPALPRGTVGEVISEDAGRALIRFPEADKPVWVPAEFIGIDRSARLAKALSEAAAK